MLWWNPFAWLAARALTEVEEFEADRDVLAAMAFLSRNAYPAQMFMGDTGSMFIGGAVVAAAMLLRQPLILVLIAFWMLMSSLSDIIQITYFKKTHGKRIFKMAPIHHHFELCGIHETKIVTMYMVTTAILCVITLLGVL